MTKPMLQPRDATVACLGCTEVKSYITNTSKCIILKVGSDDVLIIDIFQRKRMLSIISYLKNIRT